MGEVEGRAMEGNAVTQRAYGNEEYDRELGSGGGKGESCCHVSHQLGE